RRARRTLRVLADRVEERQARGRPDRERRRRGARADGAAQGPADAGADVASLDGVDETGRRGAASTQRDRAKRRSAALRRDLRDLAPPAAGAARAEGGNPARAPPNVASAAERGRDPRRDR